MQPQNRKRIIEACVVLVILGGIFGVLYPAVRAVRDAPSRFTPGPPGEMVPSEPPQEANRIVHESGVSIIVPPNWEKILDYGPETPFFVIAARVSGARRLTATLTIQRAGPLTDADLSGMRPLTFQGFTAREQMQVAREWTFDDPPYSGYTLYVDVDGEWWQVTYSAAAKLDTLPPEVRAYIETITFPRADDAAEASVTKE